MKALNEEIKKGIYKKIYVLYGPESYNRNRFKDVLKKTFVTDADEMNCTVFSGKDTDVNEVISLAETMPFFSEKRVIVVDGSGFFEQKCEELADFIPEIPESTCLIFSEEKIDSRLAQTKAAKEYGTIAQFLPFSPREMKDWIVRRLTKEHRKITSSALEMFMSRTGDDLMQVSNDLEKVISYTFGRDAIYPEDVDAVCPEPAQDRIFQMIDAIIAHNLKRAFSLYRDLLKLHSEPRSILALLREQYRLMFHLMCMSDEGASIKDMSEALSVSDKRATMALSAARKSSKIRLSSGIEKCAGTDERIKNGLIDETIGVETLIAELCI